MAVTVRRIAIFTLSLTFSASAVDFNREIRPILSDRCFTCHGPDAGKRQSKLRLDTEEGVREKTGEIVRRVSSDDVAKRMPPAWAGQQKLSAHEIELLTKWVADGATWQTHWSFIPPKKPAGGDSIDDFVRARLEREGLTPAAEADRRALIRRVSLDLTGLPPTVEEVRAFVADAAPNAYEKVVDRLLASPHYGERMAERWLDAARYADTNGYQTDGERSMWRWRDWVIDAFNSNKPYDQFTVEQIAGDLLPQAKLPQIIATGFNRNHRGNGEGGIIAEEYAAEYVVDRVETTSTVFMGLTLGCARCHNHKYDPFTQKEFYRMFAYFNNVPERGKAFKYGNSPPVVPAPTAEQEAKLHALEARLTHAEQRFAEMQPTVMSAQAQWERNFARSAETDWAPSAKIAVHLPLTTDLRGEIHRDPPKAEAYRDLMENGPVVKDEPPPDKIEPVWKGGLASGMEFDGKRYVEVGNVANFGFYDSFTFSAWIRPAAPTGTIISRAKDEDEGPGLSLRLKDGHLQGNLVLRWLDDGGRVESDATVPLNTWSHVMLTYDGTRLASAIKLYLNGQELKTKLLLDDLNQSFSAKEPLRIGAGLGTHFQGAIRDVRIYRAALSPKDAQVLAVAEPASAIAKIPAAQRTEAQADKLRRCFLDKYAPEPMQQAAAEVADLRENREKLIATFPTVMVMQESPAPRETHVLLRGAYDHPGDKVTPGVPAVLPPLPPGVPNNRLGLAKWLVDPANPLTARVAVNRFWQMYFGTGLVKTVEDFGSQGEAPVNPELLDWLATTFTSSGWDIEGLQKTIVMSATYRQSSKVTPELLQKDPENRLLARGPRMRLPGDMVRDQALAVSGLLARKIGGPSVKPYQPAGLWKELSGGEDYRPDAGEGLHRRSLYTFWKRTSPPPMMMNFDAAGREACVVRAVRTNTPLQALDLMNDEIFLEASRAMGQRMVREGGATTRERLAYGFELATARPPKPRELEVLLSSYQYYLDLFQTESKPNGLDPYSTVASLILNLDEVVTKQ